MKLVFDIETIGDDWGEMDEKTKESLTRWAKRESPSEEIFNAKKQDIIEGLGFSPLTGEIVALGVLDVEKEKGAVYFQAPDQGLRESEEDGVKLKPMDEKEILSSFWEVASKYNEFISFNGRVFDVPFIMVRSAIHGIKPTKNLMANRYTNYQSNTALHIDLLDQLTFYGAVRRKGNLHLWCRAFGIKSPKEGEITGDEVSRAFKDKRYEEIAKYNVDDLRATRELYRYWEEFIRFS